MGPWFIRDEASPFRPGCSYETLCRLIRRGKVGRASIIRGPTTMQFWVVATKAPGVAHLLGECHSCHSRVAADERTCQECGAGFVVESDRQYLGLASVHLLPGQASPEQIADQSGPRAPDTAPVVAAPEQEGALVDIESIDDAANSVERAAELSDEPEARTPGGPGRVIGRVALAIGVVGLCAGAIWLAIDRGVIPADLIGTERADGDASVIAPAATETDRSAAREESDDERVEQGAPSEVATKADAPTGEQALLGLLREGRVAGVVQAAADVDVRSSLAVRAALDRQIRDQIVSFLNP
jgi:hypothetical protein